MRTPLAERTARGDAELAAAAARRDFEAIYRTEPDPWGYRTAPYERAKYRATLAACGPGPFGAALELAGSIGEFTALLAPRCARLVTVDSAPTAVSAARERLADLPNVHPEDGRIPDDLPAGPWDLVVASEILYYLDPEALERTLARLGEEMAPGGRIVAVHWAPPGPERPFTAAQVHRRLREEAWARPVSHTPGAYLLDVLEAR